MRDLGPVGVDYLIPLHDHRAATAVVLTMDEVGLSEDSDGPVKLFAFEADEVDAGVIAHNPNI